MLCRRVHPPVVLALIAAGLLLIPGARASSAVAPAGQVWGLALPSSVKNVTQSQLTWLAGRRVTTVVAVRLPRSSLIRLVAAAKRARLNVIAPSVATPRSACKSTTGALRRCAALAAAPTAAVRLARRSLVDYVVVYVRTPLELRTLRGSGATRSRIVAVLPLRATAAGRSAWRAGISYATTDPALDLAVNSAPAASGALDGYLSFLPRSKKTSQADTQAPSVPQGMAFSGKTRKTVSLVWKAARDNVGVSGYRLFRNGAAVATVKKPGYTFTRLVCGKSYTFALVAYDAAGNVSNRAEATGSTATVACLTPVGSPPPAGPAPPAGSANVYLSPSGSDSNACSQSAPCKSFNRGYRVAAAGAIVEVAGGTYPAQTIATDSSKTSGSDVVFRPAGGASVVLADLTVLADHLEIRDLSVNNSASTKTSAHDVTFRNLDLLGIFIEGSSNVSLIGGRVHCGVCGYHSQISAQSGVNVAPTNIVIDGVLFEDWQAASSGQHTECLQIGGGNGITIRNSTFRECATKSPSSATSNIHVSWYGFGPKTSNVTIENNFIYESGNPFSIQAGDYSGLRIRYNSIVGPIVVFGGQGDGSPVEITGNILRYTAGMCTAQPLGSGPRAPLIWRYNVFSGGTCGATNKNAPYGFLNPLSNLHLLVAAAAINAGDPSSYPTTDIDGKTRSGTPDAGADER
ncbi:MAG: cellulose 1,4-beta-cellobiosidase [Gaiellaceae bacterium]|jgi:chitodextrinase|nr:cellulose 1,4-beta-cellobiosidase [Gaiellaceae bacterium]